MEDLFIFCGLDNGSVVVLGTVTQRRKYYKKRSIRLVEISIGEENVGSASSLKMNGSLNGGVISRVTHSSL